MNTDEPTTIPDPRHRQPRTRRGDPAGAPAPDSAALAAELEQVRGRFDAIVSNTPGLVYQFALDGAGAATFPYLSDGCQALLGLTAAELHRQPGRFLELI